MTTNIQDRTGEISIHTENILPIIKKWLYSEKEIFLRELISNAFDAINKLKKISIKEGRSELHREGKINIQFDESAKTVTISDNGLGLTADEIEKYINQIAFSGAEDFMKKYKSEDEKNQIIGHFGLGFYSAFMVADLVEINSLSYQEGATAVKWSCDGSTQYHIQSSERAEIGTDIILHINSENTEFLNEYKLTELIKKYANFLPIEIAVNDKKVNDQNPLWVKHSNEVKAEEYDEFYQKLFPFSEPALFSIHLNVDYPFNLKGILYFPKLMHELDGSKGQVKLFCQQVFVTDNAKEILPEFLTLLRGAIDCPDIPLNVSRSYLQNDPYVQKISNHIVKKVADKLLDLYKNDLNNFEKYWEDIHPFIKFGMMTNQDFYDKVKDIVLFKSTNGFNTSIKDYLERNKEKLVDTVLYCADKATQSTYLKLCKDQGLEVIFLNSVIDNHFIQFLESKDTQIKYQSIDANLSEHLIDKERESKIVDPTDNKTAQDKLTDIFKNALKNDKLKIKIESLKADDIPAIILESEYIKRLKNMSMMMKNNTAPMFDDYTLVINSNNPVIKNILTMHQGIHNPDMIALLCQHIYDLAMMGQKQLSGEQMHEFMHRSTQILTEFSGKI